LIQGMKATTDNATAAGESGPNAGECVLLALLALAGAVGLLLGRQHLAALHAEIAAASVPDIRHVPGPRRGADHDAVAAPVPVGAQVELLTPQQLRVRSLGSLADVLRSQKIGPQPAASLISRAGLPNFSLPAYLPGSDGRFSPAFAEAFGLSAEELRLVNDASAALKQRVDAVVMANTKVVEAGPDSYRFEIAAAPESAALRTEYIATIRTLLGPERYQAMALLQGEVDAEMEAAVIARRVKQAAETGATLPPELLVPSTRLTGPATLFDSFGGAARTVTITKSAGRYSYQSSGSSNGGGSNSAPDRIRAVLGAAAALMPVGF
jgi:hypothetical protein